MWRDPAWILDMLHAARKALEYNVGLGHVRKFYVVFWAKRRQDVANSLSTDDENSGLGKEGKMKMPLFCVEGDRKAGPRTLNFHLLILSQGMLLQMKITGSNHDPESLYGNRTVPFLFYPGGFHLLAFTSLSICPPFP